MLRKTKMKHLLRMGNHILSMAFMLTALATTSAFATETRVIESRSGGKVEVLLDLPAAKGPHPLVVVAPGQGYHARLPLPESLVKSLNSEGIAVVRFNWAYFVKDPKTDKPSSDLSTEVDDMNAVLVDALKLPTIDPARVAVAGKSLGTLVGWRVFKTQAKLKAVALLTPVCIDNAKTEVVDNMTQNYPDISANNRPLLLVSGEIDPLCPLPMLYANAAKIPRARAVGVGGSHSFEMRDGPNPTADSAANLDLAVKITTDFLVKALR